MFNKQFICLALTAITLSPSLIAVGQDKPLTVSAEPIENFIFYPSRSAPARVISLNNSKIPAEVSALILSIPVRVGDIVETGDILAELDCQQTQLNHAIEAAMASQLRADLELENRELKRRTTLMSGGNIGESDLDRSQTTVLLKQSQLTAQQARLEIAELNIARCSIKAPYTGVVTARLANEGEQLNSGNPVVQLIQLDALEVMANIALIDIDSFLAAKEFLFEENGHSYPLSIRSLIPVIEDNARIRQARFAFIAEQSITGSSGRLVWEASQSHIPARFLQQRDDITGVFIVENNQARFVPLADAEEGRPVALDIDEATLIVTDGRFGLIDGQIINIR